jgi:gas vesicle structural protein
LSTQSVLRSPNPSGLADVLEIILDKGLVIDAYVRLSLVGIELLTIDARIVVASVDTYLRFAEAADRLVLGSASEAQGLSDLAGNGSKKVASGKTSGMIEGVKESLGSGDGDGDGDGDEDSKSGLLRRSKS